MKRFLIRYAGNAAEREAGQLRIIDLLTFFFPLLAIILCEIFLNSLWWTIGLSVFAGAWYLFFYLAGVISGNVKGAKYALQNPRSGETWVEIKDGNEVVWESEKFTPLPALPGVLEVSTQPKLTLPKGYNTWVKWQRVYSYIAPLKAQGQLKENQILARVQTDLPDENINNARTLRDIEKAGKAGYLDSYDKFCEMTGQKKE